MIPNLVTATRLVLVIPLAAALWHSGRGGQDRWLVFALFLWIAVSDGLDGWLARRLHAVTPLGRLLDPAADKLIALVSFLTLAWVGRWGYYDPLPLWLVVVVIAKDAWVVLGYLVVLLMGIRLAIRPTAWGKAATALQLLLVLATLAGGGGETGRLGLTGVRVGLCWLVAATTVAAAVSYTWDALWKLSSMQIVRKGGRT
jgi:cardiolipin synthase